MKRHHFWLVLMSCCLAGCTLNAPLKIDEDCPGAVQYTKASGEVAGRFDDPDDAYSELFAATQHCPEAYPKCASYNGVSFCREVCRENEVFCGDRCISPLENDTYCGARGLCNDANPESEDYLGKTCGDEEICRKGDCVCARSTDVKRNGECIDPNTDSRYCGATKDDDGESCSEEQVCRRGRCKCARDTDVERNGICIDPNTDSRYCGATEMIDGVVCSEDQFCRGGRCECARKTDVERNGECIDPKTNSEHCGATKDDEGVKCSENQVCRLGQCECARKTDVMCGDECIDPVYGSEHCGAKGLCTNKDRDSDNYIGEACTGGRICDNRECRCPQQTYAFCGDGENKSCIDPINNNDYCGAKAQGLCTNRDNPSDENFAGGNCAGFACLNGICQCGDGYHLYNNGCEQDSTGNCGAHGHDCKPGAYDSAVACENGACTVTECTSEAFFAAPQNFGADTDNIVNAMHEDEVCTTCGELIKGAQVGDMVYFGHYRQLADSEEKQPLAWLVLDVDDQKGVLLTTKYVLEPRPYNTKGVAMTWERSTMRSWLNGFGKDANDEGVDYTGAGFIDVAFNEVEQKCIREVTIINLDNQYFGTEGGEDTDDKVFLLSLCEVGYEPPSDKTPCEGPVYSDVLGAGNNSEAYTKRKAYATDYAYRGVPNITVSSNNSDTINVQYNTYTSVHRDAYWWLRSPGNSTDRAARVDYYGGVYISGYLVDFTSLGVRPALWIK